MKSPKNPERVQQIMSNVDLLLGCWVVGLLGFVGLFCGCEPVCA